MRSSRQQKNKPNDSREIVAKVAFHDTEL
jgi:hypothetical protein